MTSTLRSELAGSRHINGVSVVRCGWGAEGDGGVFIKAYVRAAVGAGRRYGGASSCHFPVGSQFTTLEAREHTGILGRNCWGTFSGACAVHVSSYSHSHVVSCC